MFTHKFKIETIRILEKYNVDYIVFSNRTKEKYSIEEIAYIHDECFDLVLNETIQISLLLPPKLILERLYKLYVPMISLTCILLP